MCVISIPHLLKELSDDVEARQGRKDRCRRKRVASDIKKRAKDYIHGLGIGWVLALKKVS